MVEIALRWSRLLLAKAVFTPDTDKTAKYVDESPEISRTLSEARTLRGSFRGEILDNSKGGAWSTMGSDYALGVFRFPQWPAQPSNATIEPRESFTRKIHLQRTQVYRYGCARNAPVLPKVSIANRWRISSALNATSAISAFTWIPAMARRQRPGSRTSQTDPFDT